MCIRDSNTSQDVSTPSTGCWWPHEAGWAGQHFTEACHGADPLPPTRMRPVRPLGNPQRQDASLLVVGGVSPCVGDSAQVLKPGLRAAYRFSAKSLPWTPPTRLGNAKTPSQHSAASGLSQSPCVLTFLHCSQGKLFEQNFLYRNQVLHFCLAKGDINPCFLALYPVFV